MAKGKLQTENNLTGIYRIDRIKQNFKGQRAPFETADVPSTSSGTGKMNQAQARPQRASRKMLEHV
jgi:hypothetical protein